MTPIIRSVDWNRHRDELLAIRFAVFVDEQGVPVELEHDDQDAHARHLLASTPEGVPIATARLLPDGHIGRMAVLRAWRGRGIGTAVLRALLRHAEAQGHTSVFLHAQCTAEAFYTRLGFVAEGAVFKDAGIDHRTMRLPLGAPDG